MIKTVRAGRSPRRRTRGLDFRPVSKREYADFMRVLARDFALQYAEAHSLSAALAERKAMGEIHNILRDGIDTAGNSFYSLRHAGSGSGKRTGYIWLGTWEENRVAVAYVYILKASRLQGHCNQALEWVESRARRLGLQAVTAYVFHHNSVATSLFTKAGFSTAGVFMRKSV